jgi:predicted nucleotidyltransferase
MKKTIEKIVNFAIGISEPDKIILFGSMAHGTNNIHSDLDLLIVMKSCFQQHQIAERIEQFAIELALKADILVYSEGELAKAAEIPHSFLASIVKNGKIVYQNGQINLEF